MAQYIIYQMGKLQLSQICQSFSLELILILESPIVLSIDKAIEIINKVGEEMANELEWKEHIISAPRFLRLDSLSDSSVDLKILGDTKPSMQWAVSGELRKRLKTAFDKEGIDIPFPPSL